MSNENESVPVTQLKVYSKEGTLISTLELKDASYVIGRGEDCDIQCEGAANVSRHHAELTIRDGEAFIRRLDAFGLRPCRQYRTAITGTPEK